MFYVVFSAVVLTVTAGLAVLLVRERRALVREVGGRGVAVEMSPAVKALAAQNLVALTVAAAVYWLFGVGWLGLGNFVTMPPLGVDVLFSSLIVGIAFCLAHWGMAGVLRRRGAHEKTSEVTAALHDRRPATLLSLPKRIAFLTLVTVHLLFLAWLAAAVLLPDTSGGWRPSPVGISHWVELDGVEMLGRWLVTAIFYAAVWLAVRGICLTPSLTGATWVEGDRHWRRATLSMVLLVATVMVIHEGYGLVVNYAVNQDAAFAILDNLNVMGYVLAYGGPLVLAFVVVRGFWLPAQVARTYLRSNPGARLTYPVRGQGVAEGSA